MGNFRLKVRRSLDSSAGSPPPAPALAAAGAPSSQLAEVVVARPALPPMADYLSVEEVAADESLDEALIYVRSPKVLPAGVMGSPSEGGACPHCNCW
jgi:hypothetical protein